MALRILLVDDDDRFRAVARRALTAEGADIVAEVENGREAIQAVDRWRPDVALVDIGLPGISGIQVARHLRTVKDGPVVILISTRDGSHGARVAAGVAAGFLRKDLLSLAAILELMGEPT